MKKIIAVLFLFFSVTSFSKDFTEKDIEFLKFTYYTYSIPNKHDYFPPEVSEYKSYINAYTAFNTYEEALKFMLSTYFFTHYYFNNYLKLEVEEIQKNTSEAKGFFVNKKLFMVNIATIPKIPNKYFVYIQFFKE